jgi:hypothetical protein
LTTWMQTVGTAQNRPCLHRLLRPSTTAQGCGNRSRLLSFAAVWSPLYWFGGS